MRLSTGILDDGAPVDEDEELGLVVSSVVDDEVRSALRWKYRLVILGVVVAVLTTLLGLPFLVLGIDVLTYPIFILGWGTAGVVLLAGKLKSPNATVTRAEKRLWTGYFLPQGDRGVVYDATATLPTSEFELEELENIDAIHTAVEDFEDGLDLPPIMDDDGNVEEQVARELRDVRQSLTDTASTHVEAPVLDGSREPAFANAVVEASTYASASDRRTDTVDVGLEEATREADAITELQTLAFETDPEDVLTDLKSNTEAAVDEIADRRRSSLASLNDHVDAVGEVLALPSYTFFCPVCLGDDIESRLDPEFDPDLRWECRTCSNEFRPEDEPVPKHQLKDELVEDVWDDLWTEVEDERRRIYENIEDQKSDLKEREFEQKQEVIRDSWGRIKDIQSKLRDLQTESRAKDKAVEKIGETMHKYDRINAQRRDQFERDVRRVVEEVQEETEETIQAMEQYEEKRIQESQEEAERRAELRQIEKEKRHREKIAATEALGHKIEGLGEQLAGQHDELMDELREEHQREVLLDTRGETSTFDTVNKAHMAWGKTTGFSEGDD